MATVGQAEVQISHSGSGETVGALERVGGALAKIGAVAAGVALAGLVAVGAAAFKSASQFEMMELSLQSLSARELLNAGAAATMGEAFDMAKGKASELFNWVRQLAIQSPFSAEGVAQAFRTAEAYGFTADMAKRLTQATIDFASATGQSEAAMNSISLALGQIQAKGKLSAQEILQLTNVGVPALQYLAQHFGKTTAEISKMMERGLIPANEAVEAITKGMETDFAGAAARTQNTLQGLTSTLGDLWQMATAAFLGDMFKGFAPLASMFSGWLQSEGLPLLQEWGSRIGQAANMIGTVLAGAFQNLRAGMPVLDLLGRLFPKVFSPEVRSAIDRIGAALSRIGEAISPAVTSFIDNLGAALSSSLGENGPMIVENITNAFEGLSTFLTTNGPAIAEAAGFIGTTIGAAIGGVITIVSGIAGAIGDLLAGDFQGALDTLGNTLTGFADGVVQAFGGVDFASVLNTWGGILSNAGTIISGSVGNAIAAAQEWATGVVGALLGPLANIAGNVTGYISGAIAGVQSMVGLMAAAGAALGNGLVSGAAGVVGKIVGVVVGAVEAAIAAAKAAAGISSPSKETMRISEMMGQGFVIGMQGITPRMAGAMGSAVNSMMAPAYAAIPTAGNVSNVSNNGGGVSISLTANGVNDPVQLVDMVEREIRARGKSFAAVA